MAPFSEEKSTLRERLLAARAVHGALGAASDAVCAALRSRPEVGPGTVLLGYAATSREVAIDAALASWLALGATVCLPWVRGADLGVAAVADLGPALSAGWRGLREPAEPRREIPPEALELIVLPGVGFDLAGNRLGYGGGHFDRLLARVPTAALRIGVALDEQVVERLPTEAQDEQVDLVVTPTRTVHCPRL